MANIIYQKPSDNRAPNASVVAVSTEDASYPKANLYDLNPAKPFKFTATTGNIVWDFGSAVQMDLVALLHHNLTAALAGVKIQAHTVDSWATPSLDQTITIPAYRDDGYPRNPWVDLTTIGSRTFRWWRLNFANANAANIALGEVWLGGTKRSLTHNISWDYEKGVIRPSIDHQTVYGNRINFDLASPRQFIRGEVQTSDAGATALSDLWDAVSGRVKRFLIVEDPAVNDAWMVNWLAESFTMRREFTNNVHVPIYWEEASRGLKF